MRKGIEIGGCIEVPKEVTIDEVTDAFLDFVESKGWHFGGGFHEITDENTDPKS